MRVTVKHHQAVWETTTFTVEVESLDALRALDLNDAMAAVFNDGDSEAYELEIGDNVSSVETDFTVIDDMGNDITATVFADETTADDDHTDYVQDGGNHCPKCKSLNISGEGVEIAGLAAAQAVSCNDCEAVWTDHYAFDRVTID